MSLITSDQTGVDAINYGGDGETVVINPGVLVWGTSIGINSNYTNNTLVNHGQIIGGNQGVWFYHDSLVTNAADGTIYGYNYGVELGTNISNVEFVNHGGVVGLISGVFFDNLAYGITVINSGDLYGGDFGIYNVSATSGGVFVNSGKIRSPVDALRIETGTTLSGDPLITNVTNKAGGLIIGGLHAIFAHLAGAITLNNLGTVKGAIVSDVTGASDTITNHGKIVGSIDLGPGEDTYTGKGAGLVTGPIHGGDGTDLFAAGPARETFFGDGGGDGFDFASVLDSPVGAKRDTVADFTHGQDAIVLSRMDADTVHAHQQAFTFIGGQTFANYHAAHPGVIGMLRFDAAHHALQGNVNADFANADFEVFLPGVAAFHTNDFLDIF